MVSDASDEQLVKQLDAAKASDNGSHPELPQYRRTSGIIVG
jgi:hypothetical protein